MSSSREDSLLVHALRINHVSIAARDLEASTRFYEDVFSMERIPTPTFGAPVQWLRVGDMQLHLFLDDAYEAVRARTSDTWGWQLVELPTRQVQLYFRDPSDNLIELNWPDADTLDRSKYPELRKIADRFPQKADSKDAVLYLAAGE